MSQAEDIIRAVMPNAVLSVFGDPVIMPDGSVVSGVFSRYDSVRDTQWSNAIAASQMDVKLNPAVDLRDADAALLTIGSRIVIKGVGYLVVEIPEAGDSGLTHVDLVIEGDCDQYS